MEKLSKKLCIADYGVENEEKIKTIAKTQPEEKIAEPGKAKTDKETNKPLPYIYTEKKRIEKSFEYISYFIVKLDKIFPPPGFSSIKEQDEWEKELKEDQLRFISALWSPFQNRSIELRILNNYKKNDYLNIYFIGKVSHFRYSVSIKLARELKHEFGSFLKRNRAKYQFSDIRTEEGFKKYLVVVIFELITPNYTYK